MDHFPLYALVSGSCESMIRYTSDRGKCFRVLCHARISSVPGNSTTCWVVARHMHKYDTYVCGVHSFKFLLCMFKLWLGWNEFSAGTLITSSHRALVTLWENVVCHRIYRLVLTFVSKFVRSQVSCMHHVHFISLLNSSPYLIYPNFN